MQLDTNVCYRALRSRDARFDGKFFVAVATTGIYCRPVCPARTPNRENVRFFACAAAAEEAGFRACRRCRPETAPNTPAWSGTSATVARALRLVVTTSHEPGVEVLAARLGIGSRHLRRLFAETLGASPSAILRTRRVHLARQLIDTSRLPISQIAFAAGFASIRRFNEAMQASFGESPRAMRTRRPQQSSLTSHTLDAPIEAVLSYRPPFDWQAITAFLTLRAIPGVEAVDTDTYRRTIEINGKAGLLEVALVRQRPQLRVTLRLPDLSATNHVIERTRSIFDLDADPAIIAAALQNDDRMRVALRAHPGLRVPGCWDPFELAIRAVLGQQVTVRGATTLAGRLVQRFGRVLSSAGDTDLTHLFPRPDDLAEADIASIGMPKARAATIRDLAAAAASGGIDWNEPDAARLSERLQAIRGIGVWTAQYIAMRALREPDAFLASDLAVRRALSHGDELISVAATEQRAEAWRPWRAYAVMHLWNRSGEEQ